MKLHLFVFLLTLSCYQAFSQNDFRRFALGAGAGITSNRSDLSISNPEQMIYGSVDFYLTRYIHGGTELQLGKLSGREERSSQRYFENDYKQALVYAKLHLGQFLDVDNRRYRQGGGTTARNILYGFYLGSGGGVLSSTQVNIRRIYSDDIDPYQAYLYRGKDSNKELFIPAIAGLDLPVGKQARFIVGAEYRLNFLLGDLMDGYLITGSGNDMFSSFSLGVKYAFGRLQLY